MKSLGALIKFLVAGNDFPVSFYAQGLLERDKLMEDFRHTTAFFCRVDVEYLHTLQRCGELFELVNNIGTGNSPVFSHHVLQGFVTWPFHFSSLAKKSLKILLTMRRISFRDEK